MSTPTRSQKKNVPSCGQRKKKSTELQHPLRNAGIVGKQRPAAALSRESKSLERCANIPAVQTSRTSSERRFIAWRHRVDRKSAEQTGRTARLLEIHKLSPDSKRLLHTMLVQDFNHASGNAFLPPPPHTHTPESTRWSGTCR